MTIHKIILCFPYNTCFQAWLFFPLFCWSKQSPFLCFPLGTNILLWQFMNHIGSWPISWLGEICLLPSSQSKLGHTTQHLSDTALPICRRWWRHLWFTYHVNGVCVILGNQSLWRTGLGQVCDPEWAYRWLFHSASHDEMDTHVRLDQHDEGNTVKPDYETGSAYLRELNDEEASRQGDHSGGSESPTLDRPVRISTLYRHSSERRISKAWV